MPFKSTITGTCPGGFCNYVQDYSECLIVILCIDIFLFLVTLIPPLFNWATKKPDGRTRIYFSALACVTFYFWLAFLAVNSVYCFGFLAHLGPCKSNFHIGVTTTPVLPPVPSTITTLPVSKATEPTISSRKPSTRNTTITKIPITTTVLEQDIAPTFPSSTIVDLPTVFVEGTGQSSSPSRPPIVTASNPTRAHQQQQSHMQKQLDFSEEPLTEATLMTFGIQSTTSSDGTSPLMATWQPSSMSSRNSRFETSPRKDGWDEAKPQTMALIQWPTFDNCSKKNLPMTPAKENEMELKNLTLVNILIVVTLLVVFLASLKEGIPGFEAGPCNPSYLEARIREWFKAEDPAVRKVESNQCQQAYYAKALYHKETLCKREEVQRFLTSLASKKPEIGHLVNCHHMTKSKVDASMQNKQASCKSGGSGSSKGENSIGAKREGCDAKSASHIPVSGVCGSSDSHRGGPRKVVTFSTIDYFGFQSWRDFSDLRLIEPSSKYPIIEVEISLNFFPGDHFTAERYKAYVKHLTKEHSGKDQRITIDDYFHIEDHREWTFFIGTDKLITPWWDRKVARCILSCFFLGWPFRLNFEGNTAKHQVEVKKAIFVENTSQDEGVSLSATPGSSNETAAAAAATSASTSATTASAPKDMPSTKLHHQQEVQKQFQSLSTGPSLAKADVCSFSPPSDSVTQPECLVNNGLLTASDISKQVRTSDPVSRLEIQKIQYTPPPRSEVGGLSSRANNECSSLSGLNVELKPNKHLVDAVISNPPREQRNYYQSVEVDPHKQQQHLQRLQQQQQLQQELQQIQSYSRHQTTLGPSPSPTMAGGHHLLTQEEQHPPRHPLEQQQQDVANFHLLGGAKRPPAHPSIGHTHPLARAQQPPLPQYGPPPHHHHPLPVAPSSAVPFTSPRTHPRETTKDMVTAITHRDVNGVNTVTNTVTSKDIDAQLNSMSGYETYV